MRPNAPRFLKTIFSHVSTGVHHEEMNFWRRDICQSKHETSDMALHGQVSSLTGVGSIDTATGVVVFVHVGRGCGGVDHDNSANERALGQVSVQLFEI